MGSDVRALRETETSTQIAILIITTHQLAGSQGGDQWASDQQQYPARHAETRGDTWRHAETRGLDIRTCDTCVAQMLVFGEEGIIPGKTLGSVFHVLPGECTSDGWATPTQGDYSDQVCHLDSSFYCHRVLPMPWYLVIAIWAPPPVVSCLGPTQYSRG